jgi:hypothetical protein
VGPTGSTNDLVPAASLRECSRLQKAKTLAFRHLAHQIIRFAIDGL